MISDNPYGVPRLTLSLTSDTNMSLSQKPSLNSPTSADPVLDSVNLMMPPLDLRWTEGMFLFRTSQCPAAICLSELCFKATLVTVWWPTMSHLRRDTRSGLSVHINTCCSGDSNNRDKQQTELNQTPCQRWRKLGHFEWERENHSLHIKWHYWSM